MQEYEQLKSLIAEIEADMSKAEGGNKAAGTRVRKQMQDYKKKFYCWAGIGSFFIYMGIASGVLDAGYSLAPLALRFLLAGLVVMLIRGLLTDAIYQFLASRKTPEASLA